MMTLPGRRIGATVFAAIVIATCSGSARAGSFDGKLEFTEKGCEKDFKCYLKSAFGYVDTSGAGWQVPAGRWTNGASIPPRLRARFGSPFDTDLIRAAVIHDHYCERYVRTWSETHWVFFDALLASGVNRSRAELMYAAVVIGGPFWVRVEPGESCSLGNNCVMDVGGNLDLRGGQFKTMLDGSKLVVRASRYDDPAFDGELEAAKAKIEALGKPATPQEIEAIARSVRPHDRLLNGPGKLVIPKGVVIE